MSSDLEFRLMTGNGAVIQDELNFATGKLKVNGSAVSGTTISNVTASAAEINLCDGSVAGTAVASKLLCLGSNKNVDTIVVADGGLKLGSGSGTAIAATAAEINAACDVSAMGELVTETNVITAAESGKTFFLNSATEFVSTLPAPAIGLKYTFIIKAAPSGANYTVVTNSSANVIYGCAVSAEDAAGSVDSTNATPVDTITFVGAKAVVGDRVDVISDGTNWYASGFCQVQDAITFDVAS